MHIDQYEQTVQIHVTFTDAEKRVLEEVRTSARGPYWDADRFEDALSLDEVAFLRDAVEACLGYTASIENMFTVGDDETPEDVPGGGLYAGVADRLYREFNEILRHWGYDDET